MSARLSKRPFQILDDNRKRELFPYLTYLHTPRLYYSVSFHERGGLVQKSGARFSKVPKTFRVRKAIRRPALIL